VRPRHLVLLLALALLAGSCAYYNTLYLARKYYFKATSGEPYPVDKTPGPVSADYVRAIDLSKKVMANYPKSKWVDDAYLLWARALLGRDDPRETVNMLQDFGVRFPASDLGDDALFYLGVGYRQSHHPLEAEQTLAQFLEHAPRHKLAPYAWLERSRALLALDHDSTAAYCAGQLLARWPKSTLGPLALAARAEALLGSGQYAAGRADFQALGAMARNDDERFTFLLREVDCLEGARDFDQALRVLRQELGMQRPPDAVTDATAAYRPSPSSDRYARLMLRIGTSQLLAGHETEAVATYRDVVKLYPKSTFSAEAEYRLGYALETASEDFEGARVEYARVSEQFPNSAFIAQAQSRMRNLDRMSEFRQAGGDTLQRRAEAGFLLAEIFLFQQNKPERALEEYRKVARQFDGTPWAAKALTAQAWVLSRRLGRPAAADSLFWVVVRRYPATEAQLAARDYLEREGVAVPESLIRMPVTPTRAPVDTTVLTQPPTMAAPLGSLAVRDTAKRVVPPPPVRRRPTRYVVGGAHAPWHPRYAGTSAEPALPGDSPYAGSADTVTVDSTRAASSARPPAAAPARSDSVGRRFDR